MAPYETGMTDTDAQERLTRILESCLPEDGVDLILIDRDAASWTSSSDACDRLLETDALIIQRMISRINDGDEPALTRVDHGFLVGTHLRTENTDYGYVLLMLDHANPESLRQSWPVIEMGLSQMQCVAGLMEVQDAPVSL